MVYHGFSVKAFGQFFGLFGPQANFQGLPGLVLFVNHILCIRNFYFILKCKKHSLLIMKASVEDTSYL